MKTSISKPVFLLFALIGLATADLPKKTPITKYSGLWTNSPFTAKPPPPEAGPENNPLDDYALVGVSSIGNKSYRVTMINKKKPDEPRIYVESGSESKGFKILGVTRKAGDPTGTVVRMQSGTMTGTVSYDQKLLTIAAAAPPKPATPQPGGQVPARRTATGSPRRTPAPAPPPRRSSANPRGRWPSAGPSPAGPSPAGPAQPSRSTKPGEQQPSPTPRQLILQSDPPVLIVKTSILPPVFLLLALVGLASADLPEKASMTKYSGLWTNSPFTTEPPVVDPTAPDNPLDDYALIGVSSLGSKNYRVTLINKKKPDEPRIYVESGSESKGFKILAVTRKAGDPLGTVVRMQSGTMSGTISYDQKLLTIAPTAPKAAPPQPVGQVLGRPQPAVPGELQRQPRRVIPLPAPSAGSQVQQGQPNQAVQQNRGTPQRRGN